MRERKLKIWPNEGDIEKKLKLRIVRQKKSYDLLESVHCATDCKTVFEFENKVTVVKVYFLMWKIL